MKLFFAMTMAAISVTAFSADNFTITADGLTKARIVTGEKPPESVSFAAKELQTFVRKMSGAELPIIAKPEPKTPSILLGPAAREKIPAADMEKVKRDGYIITVIKGDLCVAGIDDSGPQADIESLLKQGITHDVTAWNFNRGTLYGVYRLLEELGMRWYMPGEFGERAPGLKTLAFSGDIRENPHFITRTVGYWSLGGTGNYNKQAKGITIMPGERDEIGFTPTENRMWELRMRGETFRIPLNHNPPRTKWMERFYTNHPDYFALLPDGKRAVDGHGAHLCYTHPDVLRENIEDIKAFAAGKTAVERGIPSTARNSTNLLYPYNRNWSYDIALDRYYSVLPNDGFRPCTCPSCLKTITPDVVLVNQRNSKMVWDFVARSAEGVPEMNIVCLAYGSYSIPYPGMKKLPPNVVVGFCAHSHPASLYYKNMFERYEKLLGEWAALTQGPMAFWQHYLAANRDADTVGMPEHTPEMYAKVLRLMARHGNHVFCEQMATSIMFELFNRYMLLKMFYNPELDERAIFNDYLVKFYGPEAGPIIGEIYAEIGKRNIEKIKQNAGRIDYWTKIYTADILKSYHAKGEAALKKAVGTPYEKPVSIFNKYYLGLMDVGLSNFNATLGEALKAPNPDLTCRYESAPPTLDGKLDEPAWKNAKAIPMYEVNTGKEGDLKTEVKSCYDENNIYFAVTAFDPEAKKLNRVPGEPGTVDGFEIFLDATHNHQSYYQSTFDLAGKLDERHYIDKIEPTRLDWKSNAKWQVAFNDDNYIVEISMPRKSFEAEGRDLSRETWGVLAGRTISRFEQSKGGRFHSTSARLRRGFHQPSLFNNLIFSK
jgi:hypothetical protein